MSLVVSLRVPDGIVTAADSLSTAQNLLEFVAESIELDCPHCKRTMKGPEIKLPPIPVPFSASSYTQKLFSLHEAFALGYVGQGIINERSVYYHVKEFERSSQDDWNLVETRDKLIYYFEGELHHQFPGYEEKAPEKWYPVGFHLNGYEELEGKPVPVTYEVYVGRKNVVRRRDRIGCTIGGDLKVIQKLWDIGKEDPRLQFKYGLLSLQDAIDLSEFLINATSTFQRFANEVPTVGGEIDIALLTPAPLRGLKWIKRKKLLEILEEPK